MPLARTLSSSCGLPVRFAATSMLFTTQLSYRGATDRLKARSTAWKPSSGLFTAEPAQSCFELGCCPSAALIEAEPSFPLLGDSVGIDPEFLVQSRNRSLRSVYCCSGGARGRGAPVTNLYHMASFHSDESDQPVPVTAAPLQDFEAMGLMISNSTASVHSATK